mmetsp:Transcript_21422/g.49437  ORF Transcript_21422/g.49437 Transcript_21422/m.49437 type:complete len:83 (+) Transcript_21422:622-870(+)
MVVFPAASRPTIKIRISFLPNCIHGRNSKSNMSFKSSHRLSVLSFAVCFSDVTRTDYVENYCVSYWILVLGMTLATAGENGQ